MSATEGNTVPDTATDTVTELRTLRAALQEAKDAVEAIIWQTGARYTQDGVRYLSSGPQDDLHDAFMVLGWPDPRLCEDDGLACEWPGCVEWIAGSVTTSEGYRHFCSAHLLEHVQPDGYERYARAVHSAREKAD